MYRIGYKALDVRMSSTCGVWTSVGAIRDLHKEDIRRHRDFPLWARSSADGRLNGSGGRRSRDGGGHSVPKER